MVGYFVVLFILCIVVLISFVFVCDFLALIGCDCGV